MNKNNNNQCINCPVCLYEFDTQERIPKILPKCGHSICKACLIQMKGKYKHECPLDKSDFGPNYKTIDDLGTNNLAIKILESKEKANEKCQLHYQNLDMICLTDGVLVCGSCLIFGDHKDHEAQKLSKVQNAAKEKKAQLQALYEKVDHKINVFHLSLENKKQYMKNIVKEKFDVLRLRIEKGESKMLSDIDKAFASEKSIFEELTNGAGDLRAGLKSKLAEFDMKMFSSEIAKLAQENIGDIEKQVEETVDLIGKQAEKSLDFATLKQKALSSHNLLKDMKIFEPFNKQMPPLSVEELELKIETSEVFKLDKDGLWNNLGELMYPPVLEIVGEKFAPKVTGMLIDLESLELSDVLQLLKNEEMLKSRANEAVGILKELNMVED